VRPKSLAAGLCFGVLLGVALGASAGFGTYIHSPIPLMLAWGWLGAPQEGAYLVHAFNSSRLFACCERAFFSTPYSHGDVGLSASCPAAMQLVKQGEAFSGRQCEPTPPRLAESPRGASLL
jgi:hypothetical protein